jgi:hypothetical protein
VPAPFNQVLITQTEIDDRPYTTSFSLIPNKLTTTYQSALQHIKNNSNCEGYPLSYDYVHVDCEVSLFKAVKHVFPGIVVRLCWFHVVDQLRKHLSKYGLIPLRQNDEEFREFYHRNRHLFFIPGGFQDQADDE